MLLQAKYSHDVVRIPFRMDEWFAFGGEYLN